jgi:signal transduction histidine kinase
MFKIGIRKEPTSTDSSTTITVEDFEGAAAHRLRHDLRQPLASMTILVDSVMSTESLPPRVEATFEEILREAQWMGRLLRSAEDDHEQVAVVDLSRALEGPCAWTRGSAPYDVEVTEQERTPVIVDPVGLERAIRNVVDNAKRAVSDGGRVQVRAWPEHRHGLLEVADSGPGFGGLAPRQGQGLVGVRRFVERFGGDLACGTSSLGGALVTIRLPLAFGW